MRSIHQKLFAGGIALALAFAAPSRAQNITTSTVNGSITDAQGAPVVGATVTAVHVPSNTRTTAVTNSEGRYSLRGLIVGGPFTITAHTPGQDDAAVSGVSTQLGTEGDVNVQFKPAQVVSMGQYVVSADITDLDSGMTGAGTTVDLRRLLAQPTINRSFGDLIRTNAFATFRTSDRVVALGQNNKFNSISVDGARINDNFGLSGSGMASFANPFSLDAIEQMSVSLSPYDTRNSGFTGAAVNVVTKRGTNTFGGSAYYMYTDSQRQGPDKFGTTAGKRVPFYQRTSGATLGGPILKDRLFFFLNYERFTQDSVASSAAFTPNATTLASVLARVAALTSVSMGAHAGGGSVRQTDTKRLAKLDWNITPDHRLSFRYSDTKGTNPSFGNFNVTSFSVAQAATSISTPNGITALSSNFYVENRVEKVIAGQIISSWSPNLRTQISYAKSMFDDPSVPPINFPSIRIFGFPGVSPSGAAITDGALNFGTNESRQGNAIATRTESYGANADYTWRQFTASAGLDHEKTSFSNLFRQGSYGVFDYTNPTDFVNDTVRGFSRAFVQTGTPIADISSFSQNGYFGQIKWDVTPRFNVTGGLRYDEIGSPIPVPENAAFKTALGITNAGRIDGTSQLATRLSFNYAVNKERTLQVRGGIGEFLGRAPWVFISNSYGNTGVGRYSQILTGASAPTLASYLSTSFDAANPIGTSATDPGGSRAINLISPGLKLPSVLRGNIALDGKIPSLKANFSVEYIQSKALNSLFIENMNIRPTTVGADGRQRYAGSAATQPLFFGYANIFRVRNIHQGSSRYVSFSLDRPMQQSWAYTLNYTHGRSLDAQNFGSSTASSNWGFNDQFNQNVPEIAHSDYEVRDRVQGSLSREFHFFRNLVTTVSLYYEGKSGNAYSWVYSGDMNGDGITANDLIAVPTGPTDPRFDFTGFTSAAQQTAYFDYINSSGLSRFAGGYAPRNAFNQPWQNRLDLRFVQEIPLRGKIGVEVFADFINFGSWISHDFFSYAESLPSPTNTGLIRSLGNATYSATGLVKPTVTLNTDGSVNFPSNSQITVNNFDARWKIQLGSRIRF